MGVEGGLGVGDSPSSSSVSVMVSISKGWLRRSFGLGRERYREGRPYILVRWYSFLPLSMCAMVG